MSLGLAHVKYEKTSLVWWVMLLILTVKRLRQMDCLGCKEFKDSLSYIVNSRTVGATM